MEFAPPPPPDWEEQLASLRHIVRVETKLEDIEKRVDTIIKLYTEGEKRSNELDRRISERFGAWGVLNIIFASVGSLIVGVLSLYIAEHVLHVGAP